MPSRAPPPAPRTLGRRAAGLWGQFWDWHLWILPRKGAAHREATPRVVTEGAVTRSRQERGRRVVFVVWTVFRVLPVFRQGHRMVSLCLDPSGHRVASLMPMSCETVYAPRGDPRPTCGRQAGSQLRGYVSPPPFSSVAASAFRQDGTQSLRRGAETSVLKVVAPGTGSRALALVNLVFLSNLIRVKPIHICSSGSLSLRGTYHHNNLEPFY